MNNQLNIKKYQQGGYFSRLASLVHSWRNPQSTGRGFIQTNPEQARELTSRLSNREHKVDPNGDNTPNRNSRRGGRTQDRIDREEREARLRREIEEKEKIKEISQRISKREREKFHKLGEGIRDGVVNPVLGVVGNVMNGAIRNNPIVGPALQLLTLAKDPSLINNPTKWNEKLDEIINTAMLYVTPSYYLRKIIPEEWLKDNPWLDLGLTAADLYLGKKGAKYVPKAAKATVNGVNKGARFLASPQTGNWTQFGNWEYRYKPGYLGANNLLNIERRPILNEALLIYKIQTGKIGLEELSEMVGKNQANWVMKNKDMVLNGRGNVNKFNGIIKKAVEGTKGKKGTNAAIDKATAEELALTPEGKLKLIQKEYLPAIEKSAQQTGINWSDMDAGSMMTGMDARFKVSPVGFDRTAPFIERYYKNVNEIIKPGGFQDQLIANKDLIRLPNGKWMGKYSNGKYYELRRPEEYVKVRWARDVKGYKDIELPVANGIYDNFPIHGTRTKNIAYLTNPREIVGKEGLWTILRNENPYIGSAFEWYRDKGYSVPFYRNPSLETPSFPWGDVSYDLLRQLISPGYNNKIMRPTGVKDANVPQAGLIKEYNWGPDALMPKSSWNTLDFEEGAGPLANNTDQDNDFYYLT